VRYELVLTDVTHPEKTRELIRIPMKSDETFRITYTHSWDLTPVTDVFIVGRNGTIIVEEEIFEWFGAGLEHNPPQGRLVVEDDGKIHVKGIGRALESVRLRVGIVAGHVLHVREMSWPLNTLTDPMNAIEFRVMTK